MLMKSARVAKLSASLAIAMGLLVTGATASTLLAREATEPDAEHPSTWTIEDRIEKRLNPQENARRWEEFLAANAKASTADRTRIVIDGSQDPGLFLPVELVSHLLATGFAPDSESRQFWRRHYERRFGVPLPADFWALLEAHARDYLDSHQKARELATHIPSADPSDRESLLAEIDQLQDPQCQRLFKVYSRARSGWGELFDRFLYLGVAPGLRMSGAEATSLDLEYVAGGCQ
jgi:hypothetical protein